MFTDKYNYAAIYARRSTLNKNGSLETQIANCTEYAYNKNFFIFKVYSESISAVKNTISEREALSNMLNDAKRGYFKTLIVTKRDRLARKFEDYLYIKNYLSKYDIQILFQDDVDAAVSNDPMSNFVDNIMMAVADFEPNRIKDKTTDGLIQKKLLGEYYSSVVPFGFLDPAPTCTNGSRKFSLYKPQKKHKDTINNIFSTFIEKNNINSIASLYQDLLDNNLITKTLNSQNVRNIILNPVYAGLMTIDKNTTYKDGELFDVKNDKELNFCLDYFKACSNVKGFVSPETWCAAVTKFNTFPKLKKTKIVDTLFSNLIYCSQCNNVMKLRSNYYRCNCEKCSISSTCLKDSLLDYFIASDIKSDLILKYIKKYKASLKSEKESVATKIKQNALSLKFLIDTLLDDNPNVEKKYLTDEINNLYTTEKSLNDSLLELDKKRFALTITEKEATKIIDNIIDISRYDDDILKLIIDIFIEKVIIHGKNINFIRKGDEKGSCSTLLESFY